VLWVRGLSDPIGGCHGLNPAYQTLQRCKHINSAVSHGRYIARSLEHNEGIAMAYKKFLVPVAAAVAALFSNTSQAITPPSVSTTTSPAPVRSTLATQQSTDPIVQRMNYLNVAQTMLWSPCEPPTIRLTRDQVPVRAWRSSSL